MLLQTVTDSVVLLLTIERCSKADVKAIMVLEAVTDYGRGCYIVAVTSVAMNLLYTDHC